MCCIRNSGFIFSFLWGSIKHFQKQFINDMTVFHVIVCVITYDKIFICHGQTNYDTKVASLLLIHKINLTYKLE